MDKSSKILQVGCEFKLYIDNKLIAIFPTEEECVLARAGYHNQYELKGDEYKDRVVIESFCLPFEAFPVKGMNYEGTKFGT